MKTYQIQSKSTSWTLDYKGEGLGKDQNFSDNGARQNEEFDNLEDAIFTAENLLSEFDEYTNIIINEFVYEECGEDDFDYLGCNEVWNKKCC